MKVLLAAGGTAYGAMVFEFWSAGLPQICTNAGAEFVLYDMEHTAISTETLRQQLLKIYDVEELSFSAVQELSRDRRHQDRAA